MLKLTAYLQSARHGASPADDNRVVRTGCDNHVTGPEFDSDVLGRCVATGKRCQ